MTLRLDGCALLALTIDRPDLNYESKIMRQKKSYRAWHIIFIINILVFSLPLRSMEPLYLGGEEFMEVEDVSICFLLNIPPEIISHIVRIVILLCSDDLKMLFKINKSMLDKKDELTNILAQRNTQVYLLEGILGRKIQELCSGDFKLPNFCALNNDVLISTQDNQILYWDTHEDYLQQLEIDEKLIINEVYFGPQRGTAFTIGYLSEDHEKDKKEQIFLWELKNRKRFLRGELYGHGYTIDTALFISSFGTLITDGIDNLDENPTLWDLSCESEELCDRKKSLIACLLCFDKFNKSENNFSRRLNLKKLEKRKSYCLKWFSNIFYQ